MKVYTLEFHVDYGDSCYDYIVNATTHPHEMTSKINRILEDDEFTVDGIRKNDYITLSEWENGIRTELWVATTKNKSDTFDFIDSWLK